MSDAISAIIGVAALGVAQTMVDIAAARKLEGVVMKADIADAVAALAPARVRRADPEQRLAVAPPGGIGEFVLELEAEKAEHRVIEALGPGEVFDPEDEMIDADDAGHGETPL